MTSWRSAVCPMPSEQTAAFRSGLSQGISQVTPAQIITEARLGGALFNPRSWEVEF